MLVGFLIGRACVRIKYPGIKKIFGLVETKTDQSSAYQLFAFWGEGRVTRREYRWQWCVVVIPPLRGVIVLIGSRGVRDEKIA